jgi:hypothetical protein
MLGSMLMDPDPLRGYAVHFTRGNDPSAAANALAMPLPRLPSHMELMHWQNDIDTSGYFASLSILWEGRIRPTSYALGFAADVAEIGVTQRCACFSATRLDKLEHLIDTRSTYGVGFSQHVLTASGGRPVSYLPCGGAETAHWTAEVERRQRTGADPNDTFWRETRFIDPSEEHSWEQEWRVPGGFNFEPEQTAFVFIPEELHETARAFFEEHGQCGTGPAYLCPYIDPSWDNGRIHEVLTTPPETEAAVPPAAPL